MSPHFLLPVLLDYQTQRKKQQRCPILRNHILSYLFHLIIMRRCFQTLILFTLLEDLVRFSYFVMYVETFIAPAGFWLRGQNPRRHPRSPRVYTYKDKEYLLKK